MNKVTVLVLGVVLVVFFGLMGQLVKQSQVLNISPIPAGNLYFCLFSASPQELTQEYLLILNKSQQTSGQLSLIGQTYFKTIKIKLPAYSYQVVNVSSYEVNYLPQVVMIKTTSNSVSAFSLVSYADGLISGSNCQQNGLRQAAFLNVSTTEQHDVSLLFYNPTEIPTILSAEMFQTGVPTDLSSIDGQVILPHQVLSIDLRQADPDVKGAAVLISAKSGLFVAQANTLPAPADEIPPVSQTKGCMFGNLKGGSYAQSILYWLNYTQNNQIVKLVGFSNANQFKVGSFSVSAQSFASFGLLSNLLTTGSFYLKCEAGLGFASTQIFQNDQGTPLTYFYSSALLAKSGCVPGALKYGGNYWLVLSNSTKQIVRLRLKLLPETAFKELANMSNAYNFSKTLYLPKYGTTVLKMPVINGSYGIVYHSSSPILVQGEYDNPFGSKGTVIFESQRC